MKQVEEQPQFEASLTEMEFKYSMDDLKMSSFVSFAEGLKPERELEAASWDYYYSGEGMPFDFIRFRGGIEPELTIKIKNNENNNNDRIEIDLPLKAGISQWLVSKFVALFGFKENFRIYKHCMIYWFEKVDIVYYTVFNKDMVEVGRRVEIEARKDYPFKTKQDALDAIVAMEKVMTVIGISPQKRMKKSNWEQFRVTK